MPALLLIRHCQTTGQAPDAPLTPKGQADALALAAPLKELGIDAAYSSPYARAVATIAPAAATCGLQIQIDARLRERDAVFFDNVDAWMAHTRRAIAEPSYKIEGEESFGEAATRTLAALADIANAVHALPAIASHGQAITSMLSGLGFGFEDWRALGNPACFLLEWSAGRLVRYKRVLASSSS